jgi:plastocyanin
MMRNPRSHTLLALLATLAMLSCGGSDNGTTDPPTTGTLRVTVTADGSGRSGVTVQRFASGSSTVAGTQNTGGDGTATFPGVDAGTHDVEIDVPEGFTLNDGETARKSANVTAGGTANLAFALSSEDAGDVEVITLSGTSFSPNDLTISPGTTVRWINQDGIGHTVTPDGHNEWSSVSLNTSGQTFEHTFDNVGTFNYFCQPHLANGMTGVIRVE